MQALDLMKIVVEKILRSMSLHLVSKLYTVFEDGAIVLTAKMEIWHKSPCWRFEISYGDRRDVSVIDGISEYVYDLSPGGRWTKRKKSGFLSDEVKLKLSLFGLDKLDALSRVSLTEGLWNGRSVWKVVGEIRGSNWLSKGVWLIDKEELVVRKFEERGVFFEFEHKGEKKQGELPGVSGQEFEVVELSVEVPSEFFEVPLDAPIEETLMDKLWELLEWWLTAR